jgi:hypothetical protein
MVTVVVYGRFLKITLRPSEASSDTDVFCRDVVISSTAPLSFSTIVVILIDFGRNKGVLLLAGLYNL